MRSALFLSFAALVCASAVAQVYPTRPLRLISPFAAGGSSDVIARIVAQRLAAQIPNARLRHQGNHMDAGTARRLEHPNTLNQPEVVRRGGRTVAHYDLRVACVHCVDGRTDRGDSGDIRPIVRQRPRQQPARLLSLIDQQYA